MELYVIPANNESKDEFVIYRPLLGRAFVGNRAMTDLTTKLLDVGLSDQQSLSQEEQEAKVFLESINFFSPDIFQPSQREFNPTTAVLLLTNSCQLRCVYCYAAAGNFPQQKLSLSTACTTIDFVCANAEQNLLPYFEVAFHGGGEPTFAWNVLQKATAYARSKRLPSRISLTSNGVWSRHQIEWIMGNVDQISISLDGSPDTQDQQRVLLNGGKSSPIILRNLATLDHHDVSYGIRMTAMSPWLHLPEDVKFICETTKCHSIQVEPAFNTDRGAHCPPTETQYKSFADAFIEAYEIGKSFGRNLHYSSARPGTVTTAFCNAPYNGVIVTPEDQIVTCYEIVNHEHLLAGISTVGCVTNGTVDLNVAARDALYQLFSERRASCRECFCYWSCAGDCYTQAFSSGVQGHLSYSSRCDMNREITRHMILSSIADGQGVAYWVNA